MYINRLDLVLNLYAAKVEGDRYFRVTVVDNQFLKLTTICKETYEWLSTIGRTKFRNIK